ncbi:MAG: DUF4388 domain-containing protein [Nitrospirae bacterium]|nr:DUF4388 domain-containing protein [Nitrospirota bacterium]
MALEGSLKEFGLADILQLIYFQRKTGILTLEGRMDKVRLLFYEGNIVSAESKRRVEANRLGKALVKKGILKEEDLQKVLEEQQSTGIKTGNILIKNGLVEKEHIQAIITSQITETVTQLFGWKEGMYEFSPQGVPVDKEIPVTLDTQHLLMEGLRILDEWSLIEGKLTLDTVFEKTGKEGIELTPDEEEIFGFVNSESDVSTIIDNSQMDNFQASKALVSLMEKGAIEPKEAIPIAPVAALQEAAAPAKRKLSLTKFVTAVVFLISFFISLVPVIPLLLQGNNNFAKIKTSEDIDGIRFRIEKYRYENGSYPPAIEQITKMTDGWGRPFIFKAEDNNFVLLSMGPDGKEGTEDDIY